MRYLLLIFTILVLLCACGGPVNEFKASVPRKQEATTPQTWPEDLTILSGPYGGTWYTLGRTVAVILKNELIPTKAVSGGGIDNLIKLHTSEADLCLSSAVLTRPAAYGESPFADSLHNVARIANLYNQYFYVVVREGYAKANNIQQLGDLFSSGTPVRLAILKPGTVSEYLTRYAFKLYEINYRDIRDAGGEVLYTNYTSGATFLEKNKIDVFIFTLSAPASVITSIEKTTAVRILSVEENIRLQLSRELGTTTHIIQAGTYKSVKKDTPVIGDYTILAVRRNLPEELVYKLTAVLSQNRMIIQKVLPNYINFETESALKSSFISIHPGAKRFYKEKGWIK
ncbi:MAG: TAXI family TRAP transporter solute-binding subunit [Candidatus Cloacimonetes bacterium]|nr:TAXI family TRAP transporter solute-binding subunit [Candidatus Cloacimonadota bacterium]